MILRATADDYPVRVAGNHEFVKGVMVKTRKYMVAVLAMLSPPCTAFAQTETEAANFVLLGEHETSLAKSEYSQPGDKPGDVWHISQSVVRDGACKYSLLTDWKTVKPNGSVEEVNNHDKIDFNALSDYESATRARGGYFITLRGQNIVCSTSVRDQKSSDFGCSNSKLIVMRSDLVRWMKAYNYLRLSYCKGRAF